MNTNIYLLKILFSRQISWCTWTHTYDVQETKSFYTRKMYRLVSRIIAATVIRVIGKIPEERISECLSEARDWHTTHGARARIRCLFSDRPMRALARVSVCLSACVRQCARGTVVDTEWLLGVIWQAEEPANPENTWVFCVVVCAPTYSASPCLYITVGSVGSNRCRCVCVYV